MRITIVILLLMLIPALAGAQSEPTAGPFGYHFLRTLSGLSGSTFGVDFDGYLSYSGPTAYSTPVAPTLGHGRFWLAGDQYSYSTKPVFDGAAGSWNYYLMYGFTVGSFNIAITDDVKHNELSDLWHLQIQYIPPKNSQWVFSVGGEDVLNNTRTFSSALIQNQPDRSFFGVGTYRVSGTGRYPLFLSAGLGTNRFGHGFASGSIQVAHPLRLWVESDGFGINAGLLETVKMGHGRGGHYITLMLGAAKGQYFLFGTGISL